jgi:hypothetical protein
VRILDFQGRAIVADFGSVIGCLIGTLRLISRTRSMEVSSFGIFLRDFLLPLRLEFMENGRPGWACRVKQFSEQS